MGWHYLLQDYCAAHEQRLPSDPACCNCQRRRPCQHPSMGWTPGLISPAGIWPMCLFQGRRRAGDRGVAGCV